jgi:uncharacterized protein YjiS (DUF1127 family)
MRDFMIGEAQSRLAYGRLTWLVRVIGNWRVRKTLKQLQRLEDYQLRDIGLDRHELNSLICQPLHTDLVWHLERRALLNSKLMPAEKTLLALPVQGRAAPTQPERSKFKQPAVIEVQKIQRGTFAA